MTATEELRRMLDERGVEWEGQEDIHTDFTFQCGVHACETGPNPSLAVYHLTPEQAIAATVGRDERESYDAGFASGMKATLQQLYGLLGEYPTLDEIEAWADNQWGEVDE